MSSKSKRKKGRIHMGEVLNDSRRLRARYAPVLGC